MRQIPPARPARPACMPLAVLPVFVDLAGKRVVVAGAGDAAVWKAELAAAAGAHVEVFAPDRMRRARRAVAERRRPAASRSSPARWRADDLAGAALADRRAGRRGSGRVRRGGPPAWRRRQYRRHAELSSFSFGSIVNRSPVVIGISTDGAAPVLGQAIRAKIEALLHPALGAWAAAAQRAARDHQGAAADGSGAPRPVAPLCDRALAARAAPTEQDLRDLTFAGPRNCGSVALVGAGPGDPELLTLKALRALQSADVILYDRLVSPEILELARREARRMLVGKAGGGASCRQDDINRLMVSLARDGKRVVRLKGGDPMVFGRAAEELAACRAAGIAVEVVPGITAALGAAAELQIPLTDRRHTRRVQLVTGHSEAGAAPAHDWPSLADPWTITAFYMSARTFADMLPKLIAAGLDPATPALAVSAATTPRMRARPLRSAGPAGGARQLGAAAALPHPRRQWPCRSARGRSRRQSLGLGGRLGVVRIADGLEPGRGFALLVRLGHGEVGHHVVRRGAVPVLDAGRDDDGVAGEQDLHRLAQRLIAADPAST